MTYQSLPYPVSVSTRSSCARSVAPGCSAPRSMRASSSSQNRGAGMPWNVTGAGMHRAGRDRARLVVRGAHVDLEVEVEGVPVEGPVGVLLGGEGALPVHVVTQAGRHRERVLHPVRLPRRLTRVGLAEQAGRPGEPGARRLDDLGAVAARDLQSRVHAWIRRVAESGTQEAAVERATGHQVGDTRWCRGRAPLAARRSARGTE